MNFLFSGQAGVIASMAREATLYTAEGLEIGKTIPANAGLFFLGCTDVSKIQTTSIDAAFAACRASWQSDRALRLFLMLIDETESADDLQEYAECLEELLASSEQSGRSLCKALYCAPLPHTANVIRLFPMIASFPLAESLLQGLLDDQEHIKFVRTAFDKVPISLFGSQSLHDQFLEHLISADAFSSLVAARRDGKNADFEIIKLMGRLRRVEGARAIIESWTSGMRAAISRLPELTPDDEEVIFFESSKGAGLRGQAAFDNARRQQSAIIEQLKLRDLDGARRFVDDLVKQQSSNSSPEQLGKSLSLLSQRAKEQGVPELHLEWARRATEVNPEDPKTFGHLADALIQASLFNEAAAVLDQMDSLGAKLFAEGGRARILRETGRLDEAREKFLAAASSHAEDPESIHSLAGAAEVLRDMMRYEEALVEYQKLTEIAPLNPIVWAGLASVLMDLGRFDEAITVFGKASKHGNRAVPKNGRATAYKLAGKFKSALRLYDEVVNDFPNDPVALCGRAGVYRAMGSFSEAQADYETAAARSPFTPVPLSGLVDLLREQGKLENALSIATVGAKRFPMHSGLAASSAGILIQQARYIDALSVYDETIQRFPFDSFIRLARAEVLRRIGNEKAALGAYDEILEKRPSFIQARLAKATLLVQLGELDEAERLVPKGPVRSQLDWSFQLVAGFIAAGRGDFRKSSKIMQYGSERSPFARQRRLFRSAWAQSELDRGHASSALRILEPAPHDVSNVIRLHALAASGRTKLARQALSEINSTDGTEPLRELSAAIARNFQIIPGGASQTRSWIFEAEKREMLFETSAMPARYDLAA